MQRNRTKDHPPYNLTEEVSSVVTDLEEVIASTENATTTHQLLQNVVDNIDIDDLNESTTAVSTDIKLLHLCDCFIITFQELNTTAVQPPQLHSHFLRILSLFREVRRNYNCKEWRETCLEHCLRLTEHSKVWNHLKVFTEKN